VLRDLTERVVVASKGRFDRALDRRRRAAAGLPHEVTTTADEFMEATLDVWELAPESATRVGHPAPFPVELPQRFIELYTWRDDVVLDPFMGVGTTGVAAVRTGRHYLGYDTDPTYVEASRKRIAAERARLADRGGVRAADALGTKAVERAAALLAEAGFAVDPRGRRLPGGLDVALVARDAVGGEWLVDVVGGFTVARPGMRRIDVLERALGRAARVSGYGERRLLVLATDFPDARSAGRVALAEARGRLLVDVLPVEDAEATVARLAAYAAGTTSEPIGGLVTGA
jgi:site-specific DNA-methyltransferase (adenine-specific)